MSSRIQQVFESLAVSSIAKNGRIRLALPKHNPDEGVAMFGRHGIVATYEFSHGCEYVFTAQEQQCEIQCEIHGTN